jgi:pyruvate,water dikinase
VVNDLIAGLGDVESAAPVLAMWDLSRLPAPAFDGAFRDFLGEHGGRGPGDWDLASPSWEVCPDQALRLVDRLRAVSDDASPRAAGAAAAARREALAAELLTAAGAGSDALRTALRATAFFVRSRERSRGGLIIGMNEMRLPMHELARRRHRRGDLHHAADLFLLLDAELDGFLADPAAYRTTLEERRTTYRSLFDRRPPYFTRDRIRLEDLPPRDGRDIARASTGTVIHGVSGAALGQVTGRARVLSDPYDERGVQPGDVLIARQTDPTWTPLFVNAAAVVVDFGSPMSHAVIVGRELGKICVVSAEDASLRIADGASVLVDGAAGTVTVL